jgi:ribose transport system ATP-binding protein
VSRAFGATRALTEVQLQAEPGQVHAIIGENGAGKSTLMRVLSGELAADSGAILLDGEPFAPKGPAEARKRGVCVVSQELAVCPHLTVLDNVMLGQEPTRGGLLDRRAMREQFESAVQLLAGEARPGWLRPDTLVGELPVAARQMVELARALVARGGCKVLILDEPTSSLGQEDAARLFAVIGKLCAGGVTVLYVSHFLEEVAQLAQAYTVLRDGATVGGGAMAGTSLRDLVELMVGRRIEQLFVRSPREPGEELLVVQELSGKSKPCAASLRLRRGEVLGIAGLVGAGRTELLRSIFGLDAVAGGSVRVGAFSGPGSPARRLLQGMGMLSEDRKGEGLATAMSIADNLALSRLPARGPLGWISPRAHRALAADWIGRLGIRARDPSQPVSDLSGGNQQKVALARLLHHGVDVLLLDEPTRGIDVGSKAQLYGVIDKLACEGKAVLMVSSYLPELLGVCDRIQVMHRGELGPSRNVEECSAHSLLQQATGAGA